MNVDFIEIEKFFSIKEKIIIDVRAPCEFAQGHIPGAFNVPLFSDEEREIVGTTYKQVGKKEAIKQGLGFVGLKMVSIVEEIERLNPSRKMLLIHCWRGGMRSRSVSWLLSTVGMKNSVLVGGYKNYRKTIRAFFFQPMNLLVLGGMTGTGKTDILKTLEELGEQVVDLEGMAHNKGSAFGSLGEPSQPTTEQFENDLYSILSTFDLSKRIWVEDESRRLGKVMIVDPFFTKMRETLLIKASLSREIRIKRLVVDYGKYSKEDLIKSTSNISEKLGGDIYKKACEAINNNDLEGATAVILDYYDQTYGYGISKRDPNKVQEIEIFSQNPKENAITILTETRN